MKKNLLFNVLYINLIPYTLVLAFLVFTVVGIIHKLKITIVLSANCICSVVSGIFIAGNFCRGTKVIYSYVLNYMQRLCRRHNLHAFQVSVPPADAL